MSGPWQSRAEFLVDQALENALAATPEQIRAIRPAVSAAPLFPPRTGFQQNAWTLMDVLNIDRLAPTYRSWTSGMPTMHSTMSDQSWSGTARNSMTEGVF